MTFAYVVLSHYPQYEYDLVKTLFNAKNDVIFIRDFEDWKYNWIKYYYTGKSLIDKINIIKDLDYDYVMLIDGDDILTDTLIERADYLASIGDFDKYGMVKFMSYKIKEDNSSLFSIWYAIKKHLDWHSTGTVFRTDMVYAYSNYSVDKQIFFNFLNSGEPMKLETLDDGRYWYKRKHNSRMSFDKFIIKDKEKYIDFHFNSLKTWYFLLDAVQNNNALSYVSYNIITEMSMLNLLDFKKVLSLMFKLKLINLPIHYLQSKINNINVSSEFDLDSIEEVIK